MRWHKLIAVDWGSTHLRVTLVDEQGKAIKTVSSQQGVLYAKGQFQTILKHSLKKFEIEEENLPIMLCGMVGSNRGWMEIPYVDCPAGVSEIGKQIHSLSDPMLNHDLFFVPGLRYEHENVDLMRGEETQVLGALSHLPNNPCLFCLPGTHSKWVYTEDQMIQSFHTLMTGELFQLLQQNSLLAIPPEADEQRKFNESIFLMGVRQSQQAKGLLHDLFQVRVQSILGNITPDQRRDFLSGILIGTEIKTALSLFTTKQLIYLIADNPIAHYYQLALGVYQLNCELIASQVATLAGLSALTRSLEIISESV